MSDRVTVRFDGSLAYVTLSRADKLNGLDLDMLDGPSTPRAQCADVGTYAR
ncbi:hypothetical protein SAMN05444695_12010 [Rhodococcus triatomae]|uniref:Enoyl-CoA hydratase n=1 Tax=Rhodococcus triatomae TaxID=300028 RepID=A0A1G8S6U1_9NOCA|nr:hypothetical protein SAMN05444695_12010 [Rhodococcus triatomae]